MKQAGVMLIIKDGLILGIPRRHDQTKWGLPGGKFDEELDKSVQDTAIRETAEETGIKVKDCILIYKRVEPGDGPNGVDYHSYCYYASDWEGDPIALEGGIIGWITAAQVTASSSAFGDYNRKTLDVFKKLYPNVNIKGE